MANPPRPDQPARAGRRPGEGPAPLRAAVPGPPGHRRTPKPRNPAPDSPAPASAGCGAAPSRSSPEGRAVRQDIRERGRARAAHTAPALRTATPRGTTICVRTAVMGPAHQGRDPMPVRHGSAAGPSSARSHSGADDRTTPSTDGPEGATMTCYPIVGAYRVEWPGSRISMRMEELGEFLRARAMEYDSPRLLCRCGWAHGFTGERRAAPDGPLVTDPGDPHDSAGWPLPGWQGDHGTRMSLPPGRRERLSSAASWIWSRV